MEVLGWDLARKFVVGWRLGWFSVVIRPLLVEKLAIRPCVSMTVVGFPLL